MLKSKFLTVLLLGLCFSNTTLAENSTGFDFTLQRYIYKESNSGGISVDLKNQNNSGYLMESWIANADSESLLPKENIKTEVVPFIILPPLKMLDANTQTSWNIRRTGNKINNEAVPDDRESLFWIGIRGIPSEEKNKKESSVQLNIIPNFYFKLLYRPKKIEDLKTEELVKKIKITRENNVLILENPTPFYFTFEYLKVAGISIKNGGREITLPPFSKKDIALPSSKTGKIEWQLTNEYLMGLGKESSN
ncbi:molecular chaperone [Providencia vermicola]|uniref:fimbrial biogenesis chaperone n=1 Tax=Providencia vermicola TaxID=333965 RepID=UPI001CEC5E82|nr:molecular chaperone [Providencia vermicola]